MLHACQSDTWNELMDLILCVCGRFFNLYEKNLRGKALHAFNQPINYQADSTPSFLQSKIEAAALFPNNICGMRIHHKNLISLEEDTCSPQQHKDCLYCLKNQQHFFLFFFRETELGNFSFFTSIVKITTTRTKLSCPRTEKERKGNLGYK